MPQVEFEPTIPVFERAKTVYALDRAATVIGIPPPPHFPIRINDVVLYLYCFTPPTSGVQSRTHIFIAISASYEKKLYIPTNDRCSVGSQLNS
jgi:hypothetical protein